MFDNVGAYAKAIYAVVMAVVTAVYVALEDGGFGDVTDRGWVAIVIAGLTALGVYLLPNKPDPAANR